MKMMKPVLAAAIVGLLAACATTTDSERALSSREVAQRLAQPGPPDEMICESVMRTGERIPRRMCLTRAEREALRRDGVEVFEDQSVRALRVNPGGG